ncbi:CRE-LBP-4 protein [Aphelenchoides avenae]|nr:CRE-LBP-4 protein [Aphelenchus avenae]
MPQELPPQFVGKFKLTHSENFEEYLATKGLPWILRKMVSKSSLTKVLEPAQELGRYNLHTMTSFKNVSYKNWTLGETFEDLGFDGKKHEITFRLVDGAHGPVLEEHHEVVGEDEEDTYRHECPEEGKLLIVLHSKGVDCRRHLVRQE